MSAKHKRNLAAILEKPQLLSDIHFTQQGKYDVILADPPWEYRRKAGRGVANDHYGTMTDKQILQLPVGAELAGDNCALFLWVTSPRLTLGMETVQAWGFEYKTVFFTWVKTYPKSGQPVIGVGHYSRPAVELCLLGMVSSLTHSINSHSFQAFEARSYSGKRTAQCDS
jgi:N6-adenosine-specific RNA methylase IME4